MRCSTKSTSNEPCSTNFLERSRHASDLRRLLTLPEEMSITNVLLLVSFGRKTEQVDRIPGACVGLASAERLLCITLLYPTVITSDASNKPLVGNATRTRCCPTRHPKMLQQPPRLQWSTWPGPKRA